MIEYVRMSQTSGSRRMHTNNILTINELCNRLDNEFDDVELSIHDSPTKGTVAVVYFYENKVEEVSDD